MFAGKNSSPGMRGGAGTTGIVVQIVGKIVRTARGVVPTSPVDGPTLFQRRGMLFI